ncbi:MAG: dipicolinate synthase subunit DpsA [Ruminococcus sp.]|nr:dipicolinate synthase subunit DpsA [Oscillospiraceae bacterium]MBR2724868.1 dipicolinate synthase subunit DpsA [Ruminococcus sp.]
MNSGYGAFAIIGGDKRQLFCARSLSDDGYAVTLGGFDSIAEMKNIELTTPFEAALMSDTIILPLPCLNSKGQIPDPFSKDNISLTDDLITAMKGKRIFCGMQTRLSEYCPKLTGRVFDYYEREEFAVYNAQATAEGALEVAMQTFEGTIHGSECLVCGYGRIGKVLTSMLRSLGAKVTVSARKPSDLAWIELAGAKAVRTDELYKLGEFNIIFNTVPAKIFTPILLAKIAMNAVVIDLASGEGGVDKYAAERMGITHIHALSLPGKAAPKTAGEIIKNTIYHILEEDDR